MRKILFTIAACFTIMLSACKSTEEMVSTEITTLPVVPTEVVVTEPAVIAPTDPIHSDLYIPGVDVEDVILYFNEVCLDAEIVNSGNPKVLQKWVSPIRYTLHGDHTEEDLSVLSGFARWLNTIEGFPGIEEAGESDVVNLRIHFSTQSELISIMGENFSDVDGAVTFWYDSDEIYDAVICYRTDIVQYTRNSVILEELYNCLGPIQDTELRPDSIIYTNFSEPQNLTQMDELLLKLLYHPQLLCGMDAESCEAVIRQLYY